MRITPSMYRVMTTLGLPLASLYLMYRSRRQPEYRRFWNERFAWAPYPGRTQRPRVWIHAVSVGETNATRPLIQEILNKWGDCDILLTHMTPTGREAGTKLVKMAPGRIEQCYLPYDAPYAVEKFFRRTRPTIGIIMETEVWPNVMAEAKRLGIPMILANARESEKSMKKAEKYIDVMRPAFESFSLILAQSEGDKERLAKLGGQNIHVCGSLKFDIQPHPSQQALACQWREMMTRPIVMFASTRDGEEQLIADRLAQYKQALNNPLFMVVPRHPQRFEQVYELLKAKNLVVQKRSEIKSPNDIHPETDVLLGDSMGEMIFYCALSSMVVMGGSFGDFGSQNVIEPAMEGCALIVGPSIYNFETIIKDGLKAKAMVQVENMDQAFEQLKAWAQDEQLLAAYSERAKQFAKDYSGATHRMMGLLEEVWNTARKN